MFEGPACTLAKFSDYNVAVAEHLDVKVDVETRLRSVRRSKRTFTIGIKTYISGYEHLRDMCRKKTNDFRNWRHLERGADNDDQIDKVLIMLHQALVKPGWETFAKECDIRLLKVRPIRQIVVSLHQPTFITPAAAISKSYSSELSSS